MKNNLFIVFLTALLLMMLTSCGNSKDQSSENTTSQTETDNERLQAEVDALQSKLDSLQTGQATAIETAKPHQIAPKQRSLEEMLIGEWFEQHSFKDGGPYVISFVFNADGTGSEIETDYALASDKVHAIPDYTGVITSSLTWSLDGNTVRMVSDFSGSYDFAFEDSKQQLQDGISGRTLVRIQPTIPDGYVTMESLLEPSLKNVAALKRRFLGEWCWDVMVWRFNDDGTGVMDIPAFGRYPADKKEFEFMVTESSGIGDVLVLISWADGKVSRYFATFGNESGGSVMLDPQGGNAIKLTRSYDMSNSPITDEILQEGIELFESVTDPVGYIEGILQEKLVESFKSK